MQLKIKDDLHISISLCSVNAIFLSDTLAQKRYAYFLRASFEQAPLASGKLIALRDSVHLPKEGKTERYVKSQRHQDDLGIPKSNEISQ
ncbi:uncharacterized protein PHALS_03744 [Plasmopara halstedii]|uniref:Uncharacterized protein n=1 Tax=Plasmopara halstedii TaxID=4781 RepID=A0A0P1B0C3_PLAHL|nr:uncharacterized protein PHALS_03744 [Plasmopara halstedii]CEG47089.1 hypothetical protein PHALS_03744 [Plasmopara halstedii]|eukprot:XP_024583458.1 hypothetical protein PHALS_03744 [Plasmopara halstedii]